MPRKRFQILITLWISGLFLIGNLSFAPELTVLECAVHLDRVYRLWTNPHLMVRFRAFAEVVGNRPADWSAITVMKLQGPRPEFTGSDAYVEKCTKLAGAYSKLYRPVIIVGKVNTPRLLAAAFMHVESGRTGNFVTVDLAEFDPEQPDVFRAALFGYVGGTVRGEKEDTKGVIELAEGGTLVLHHLDKVPFEWHEIVARFLEDRMLTPTGQSGFVARYVNVRVFATAADVSKIKTSVLHRLTPSLDVSH